MALSDGRKSFPIGLAVLIQYRSVTATQPPSHVAVAITLNAKASSLKILNTGKCCHDNNNMQLYCCLISLLLPFYRYAYFCRDREQYSRVHSVHWPGTGPICDLFTYKTGSSSRPVSVCRRQATKDIVIFSGLIAPYRPIILILNP